MSNNDLIIWYEDLKIEDVPKVGGKNAALGEMVSSLAQMGVNVPGGFAITAQAYNFFVDQTDLRQQIEDVLADLDTHDIRNLQERGKKVRDLILKSTFPDELVTAITDAYQELETRYGANSDVAVRSSATAEDLPGASFAGQQETYLNVKGVEQVIEASHKCMASLFTNRAISYRHDKGFSHSDVALSVGVQKMVRSDIGTSGVMFTIDTESGFEDVVIIDSIYGLGEMIVQGKVTPDEFIVFKPTFKQGFDSIITKDLGNKDIKMIYKDGGGTDIVDVPKEDHDRYSLSEEEIKTLADWGIKIEDHFSEKHGHYQPMDIEWAKDGQTNELFIVQARPETVHSTEDKNVYKEYFIKEKGKTLIEGIAVGKKIGTGAVHVIKDVEQIHDFKEGEVLVTEITDPDWEPIMKIASAIVTDKGGRTSHAAIVSRELGIPCIVGTEGATEVLQDGQDVTVDCSSKTGVIYDGILDYETTEHRLDNIPEIKTHLNVNIGSPDEAFKNHYLPVHGVGLGRLEFIISSYIQCHPNALLDYEELSKSDDPEKKKVVEKIDALTVGHDDKVQYYVDELAEGIAKISAAFYPGEVIIRFSDFKTNEYATLTGGSLYEPEESNPMIGWRGASRYYHEDFKEAFGLECKAIKKVRETMGLKNVTVMVPFCRTVEEGLKVLEIMKEHGLDPKSEEDFNVYVMCEIPANVELADEFLEVFDGFSIGSNDLTQLTVGLDRDNDVLAGVANEKNPAVKKLVSKAIHKCTEKGKYIGICGQAPSDFPEFTEFLIEEGIESVSVTPDTVLKTLELIAEKEKEVGV